MTTIETIKEKQLKAISKLKKTKDLLLEKKLDVYALQELRDIHERLVDIDDKLRYATSDMLYYIDNNLNLDIKLINKRYKEYKND